MSFVHWHAIFSSTLCTKATSRWQAVSYEKGAHSIINTDRLSKWLLFNGVSDTSLSRIRLFQPSVAVLHKSMYAGKVLRSRAKGLLRICRLHQWSAGVWNLGAPPSNCRGYHAEAESGLWAASQILRLKEHAVVWRGDYISVCCVIFLFCLYRWYCSPSGIIELRSKNKNVGLNMLA